jgi:hypothetical protein
MSRLTGRQAASDAFDILVGNPEGMDDGLDPSTRDLITLQGIQAINYLDDEELLCHVDEILSRYEQHPLVVKLRSEIEPIIGDSPFQESARSSGHHEHLNALARAAADNDSIAEERGMEAAAEVVGLNPEDVFHVAEQRALRAVLTSRGKPLPGSKEFVALTRAEMVDVAILTALSMDGIVIGWRAGQQQN